MKLPRCWLHALLMLLVIASGTMAAVQTAQHGDSHSSVDAAPLGWHDHDHRHSDHHHQDDQHDVVAQDDEHGHHFHVHLPLQALLAAEPELEWSGSPALRLAANPPSPFSLNIAPPVPPPNA
jgi:uncharacterized protein involved in copper resistance